MSWMLDVGGILAGLAAILSAVWSRKAKTAAQAAAQQTNGPLKAQAGVLDVILDGQRSLGHQIGEVREDMGRMDDRLSGELAYVRDFITPAGDRRGGRRRRRQRNP